MEHCEIDGGDRSLELHVHVHHAVLQDLKAADGLAELVALLAVIDGIGQHPSHTAHHLGTNRGRALGTEQCGGGRPDAVEGEIRRAVVHRPIVVGLQSRCRGVDFNEKQRDSLGGLGMFTDVRAVTSSGVASGALAATIFSSNGVAIAPPARRSRPPATTTVSTWLHHQRMAQRLGNNHHLRCAAAHSAYLLG